MSDWPELDRMTDDLIETCAEVNRKSAPHPEDEARAWLMLNHLPELINSGGVVYDLRDIYTRIAAQERERVKQQLASAQQEIERLTRELDGKDAIIAMSSASISELEARLNYGGTVTTMSNAAESQLAQYRESAERQVAELEVRLKECQRVICDELCERKMDGHREECDAARALAERGGEMSGINWMTENDWLHQAQMRHEYDTNRPMWREHWNHTVFARGEVKFTGSYEACKIAIEAYRTEPYEIRDITGKALVTNR